MVRDVAAVAAPLMQEVLDARGQPLAAVLDGADHRFRDVQGTPGAAGEIEVAVHVRAGKGPQRRLGQRAQARPGPRHDLHRGGRGERHAGAVRQDDSDRQVAPAVTTGDDAVEGLHRVAAVWSESKSVASLGLTRALLDRVGRQDPPVRAFPPRWPPASCSLP